MEEGKINFVDRIKQEQVKNKNLWDKKLLIVQIKVKIVWNNVSVPLLLSTFWVGWTMLNREKKGDGQKGMA